MATHSATEAVHDIVRPDFYNIDSLLTALDSGEAGSEFDRPSIFSRRRKRDLEL